MAAIRQQMATLTALAENHQNDIESLDQLENRGGATDLISSLRTVVLNAEFNKRDNVIEPAWGKKKKKKKRKGYYEYYSSNLDMQTDKLTK